MSNLKEVIEQFLDNPEYLLGEEWRKEIIDLAFENYIEGSHNGVVLLNENGELEGNSWTSNTVLNEEYPAWELLKEKYGKNANFLDREQLADIPSCGVLEKEGEPIDLDTRLKGYLYFHLLGDGLPREDSLKKWLKYN